MKKPNQKILDQLFEMMVKKSNYFLPPAKKELIYIRPRKK